MAAERVNRGEGVRIGRKGVRKMIGLVYDVVSRYRWDWVGERERERTRRLNRERAREKEKRKIN